MSDLEILNIKELDVGNNPEKLVKEYPEYEYIGRYGKDGQYHMLNTPPGTLGWLGNPIPVSSVDDLHDDRAMSVHYFTALFKKKMEYTDYFERKVKELAKEKEGLVCWCYPKLCHGDVIKQFVERGGISVSEMETKSNRRQKSAGTEKKNAGGDS